MRVMEGGRERGREREREREGDRMLQTVSLAQCSARLCGIGARGARLGIAFGIFACVRLRCSSDDGGSPSGRQPFDLLKDVCNPF